jgi:protein TonB
MKKWYLLAGLLINFICEAQKKNDLFYLYDADFNAVTDAKKATYFMIVEKKADTAYVCRTYNMFGPMLTWETFKDKELTIQHGLFIWYGNDGKADSCGGVQHGKKDKFWYYYNPDGNCYLELEYDAGKKIGERRFTQWDTSVRTDSSDKADADKFKTENEMPAFFKGGIQGWIKFLQKNLIVPERTTNLKKNGPVRTQFTVNKEGVGENFIILTSLEWAADDETLRVLKKMPKWIPAQQKGINVTYSAIQSIFFQGSE